MKKNLIFLFAVLLFLPLLGEPINIQIIPPRVTYNYFYPSNIDPENPDQQPIIFNLLLENQSDESISDYLFV